jgi:hypothetical protein
MININKLLVKHEIIQNEVLVDQPGVGLGIEYEVVIDYLRKVLKENEIEE